MGASSGVLQSADSNGNSISPLLNASAASRQDAARAASAEKSFSDVVVSLVVLVRVVGGGVIAPFEPPEMPEITASCIREAGDNALRLARMARMVSVS